MTDAQLFDALISRHPGWRAIFVGLIMLATTGAVILGYEFGGWLARRRR